MTRLRDVPANPDEPDETEPLEWAQGPYASCSACRGRGWVASGDGDSFPSRCRCVRDGAAA